MAFLMLRLKSVEMPLVWCSQSVGIPLEIETFPGKVVARLKPQQEASENVRRSVATARFSL